MSSEGDFHCHSNRSDGTRSPADLVAMAAAHGVRVFALTDHDTLAGWSESRRAAAATGVEWIPGCEISTRLPTGTVHVLAYDADAGDTDLQDLLSGIRTARDARNDAILGRLDRLGVGVTREDVEQAAPSPLIARPHIAMALVHRGHVEDIREAFDRYLRDGGPAYVPVEAPTPEEAIEIVAAARGMAVIAHPRQMKLGSHARQRRVFTRWRDLGLAGIEVDHQPMAGFSVGLQHETARTRLAAQIEHQPLLAHGGHQLVQSRQIDLALLKHV